VQLYGQLVSVVGRMVTGGGVGGGPEGAIK